MASDQWYLTLCVCVCVGTVKEKPPELSTPKLGTHILYGRTSARIDSVVRRSKVKVTQLSNAPQSALVCKPIWLLRFLVVMVMQMWSKIWWYYRSDHSPENLEKSDKVQSGHGKISFIIQLNYRWHKYKPLFADQLNCDPLSKILWRTGLRAFRISVHNC